MQIYQGSVYKTRWMTYAAVTGLLSMALWACDASTSTTTNSGLADTGVTPDNNTATDNATQALSNNEAFFPSSLTLASPLQTTNAPSQATSTRLTRAVPTAAYTAQIEAVEDILNGTDPLDCGFQPENFFVTAVNAACYGPPLPYQNHPDAIDITMFDGTLPSGDVGIWLETNPADMGLGVGEACAAAQLNHRMRDITWRGINALQVTASMKCVTNYDDALTFPMMPDDLESRTVNLGVDVRDGMNAMAERRNLNVDFTTATINLTRDDETGEAVYTYALAFIYDANADGRFDEAPIEITLVHRSNATMETYRGRLSYAFNDATPLNEGNCINLRGGRTQITRAGSLLYAKSSGEVHLDARFGTYCGHDANAFNDGLVDPSRVYSTSRPDGWTDNFNWFTGRFDPAALTGDYAYAWQAGFADHHTRVFNLHLDRDNSLRSGTAFFGFGDDIRFSDGSIRGMICNWSGPLNQHRPLAQVAQMQHIEESATHGGLFVPTLSSIAYAPVNDCRYDTLIDNVNGDFLIDLDADGDLKDETHGDIDNEMQGLNLDGDTEVDDYNGNGIPDVIEDTGFQLPGSPENF